MPIPFNHLEIWTKFQQQISSVSQIFQCSFHHWWNYSATWIQYPMRVIALRSQFIEMKCIKDPLCDKMVLGNPDLATSGSQSKHNSDTFKKWQQCGWQTERKWGATWTQTNNVIITWRTQLNLDTTTTTFISNMTLWEEFPTTASNIKLSATTHWTVMPLSVHCLTKSNIGLKHCPSKAYWFSLQLYLKW